MQMQTTEALIAENRRLMARVDELLGTCNSYLQDARDARAEARKWQMNHKILLDATFDLTAERDALKRALNDARNPKPQEDHHVGEA